MTRVIQRVRSLGLVDELVVATDSPEVVLAAERTGVRAVLTSPRHRSGTDRVAEVAGRREYAGYEVIANIQGDEPFLPGEALAGALGRVESGDDIGTAAAPLAPEDVADPARVKVVTDHLGRALYFSRSPIPHQRAGIRAEDGLYWQHLGVYGFRRAALERWAGLAPPPEERAEQLEQLRALHHGMRVGVARLASPAEPGVDTLRDLRRAEAHWTEEAYR